jgi:hypothetical protein
MVMLVEKVGDFVEVEKGGAVLVMEAAELKEADIAAAEKEEDKVVTAKDVLEEVYMVGYVVEVGKEEDVEEETKVV